MLAFQPARCRAGHREGAALGRRERGGEPRLDGDHLVIVKAYADEGPTLKRCFRARGRVNRIFKRTCHITIVLEQLPQAARPQRAALRSRPPRPHPLRRRRRRDRSPAEESLRRTPRKKKTEEVPA